ncbi:MAG: phosphatidate cytidylyltransferase [Blastocatellia bacterium]|jgi:phosphatidate cytidylyltransferase|nr:phosphatidate cytidylyltransferase [Blastocatellia bacterium]
MSRLITALIALPILVASILVPVLAPLFVAIAVAAMVIGLYEFWWLGKKGGVKPDVVVGYGAAAAIFAVFYFNELGFLIFIIPVFIIAALSAATLKGGSFDKMMASVSVTVLGVLYVALLGGHLVALRTAPFTKPGLSTHLLSFFFLVIMGSDTGAYYSGRTFGRHKLAPKISPGKTWEGAVGGMVASLVLAVVSHYWFFPELSLKAAIPLAAAMNVLGVIGDLTESALKRGAGAKDAAKILPGHGGLLDRLDSLLFNAPVIYYFAQLYFR